MKFIDSIFKPAKSGNQAWNLMKTYLQTAVFWLVFLYLLPQLIHILELRWSFPHFTPLIKIGWTLFAGFSCLGLYSGYTMSWWGKGTPLPMDCPNSLVIRGPYKWVRNPMAVAGIGQGISVGLMLGSYSVVVYALLGSVLWHLLVRPSEERDLEKRFGAAYMLYKAKTWCWVPKPS